MCKNSGKISSSMSQAGGICGCPSNSTIISNCENTRSASISASDSWAKAGGISGILDNSTIRQCSNYGTVTGNNLLGGIVSQLYNSSSIISCTNSGTINATGNQYIGEIFGYKDNSSTVN